MIVLQATETLLFALSSGVANPSYSQWPVSPLPHGILGPFSMVNCLHGPLPFHGAPIKFQPRSPSAAAQWIAVWPAWCSWQIFSAPCYTPTKNTKNWNREAIWSPATSPARSFSTITSGITRRSSLMQYALALRGTRTLWQGLPLWEGWRWFEDGLRVQAPTLPWTSSFCPTCQTMQLRARPFGLACHSTSGRSNLGGIQVLEIHALA